MPTHSYGRVVPRRIGGAIAVLMATSVTTVHAQQPPAPPASAQQVPAQPAPAQPAPGDATVTPEAAKKEAQERFEKGIELLKQEAWAAALAEFMRSRELYPTRAATNNAAIALRKLQRFDESLDMFETFLRDFPNTPAGERALAQRAVEELRALVGTVEITGGEPGSSVVVSGQDRGEYPLVKPLRVAAGAHVIKLFKEGYEPFEGRVDVAGGQTSRVVAKMQKLTASGRLKVAEQTGRTLDVVVDNVSVGRTPWEGLVSVGTHSVTLRGEGKVGTQPAVAPVKSGEVSTLTLRAEDLESAMRVDPVPAGADVSIDSVPVGRGVWLGRLRTGEHQVYISADGFLPSTRKVNLERGGREIVRVSLDRNPDAAVWRKPPKVTADVDLAFAMVPNFAGTPADCSSGCSRSLGLGGLALAHGVYEFGSGFGIGIELGYLLARQSTTGRATELQPNGGLPMRTGTVDDDVRLSSFLGGVSAGYHTGETIPVLFRLGAGIMAGQVRDERSGSFTARSGSGFDAYPVADFESATYFYFDPQVRVGARVTQKMELSAGVQALVMLAVSQPKWNDKLELAASTDGIGTYKADPLLGQVFVLLAPTVSARYEF